MSFDVFICKFTFAIVRRAQERRKLISGKTKASNEVPPASMSIDKCFEMIFA